jgi:hypothetical protein
LAFTDTWRQGITARLRIYCELQKADWSYTGGQEVLQTKASTVACPTRSPARDQFSMDNICRSNCMFRTNQPSTNLASKNLTLEKFPLTFHVSVVEKTKGFYAYFWVLSSINHWPIFCGNQQYVLKCPPWADKNICVVMGRPIILQISRGCFTLVDRCKIPSTHEECTICPTHEFVGARY